MNIKITLEEHKQLLNWQLGTQVVGSHLYGTNTDKSDTDILCFYDDRMFVDCYNHFPNYHQFQYDDVENNIQYLWTSIPQFWKNQISGDSAINTDVVLFGDSWFKLWDDTKRLKYCRTYKVIKSHLGFAKRDMKQYNKPKNAFHVNRCLYIAECLIKNQMPSLTIIKNIEIFNLNDVQVLEKTLRKELNRLYDSGDILTYFIPEAANSNPLYKKLLQSNNTREFKY